MKTGLSLEFDFINAPKLEQVKQHTVSPPEIDAKDFFRGLSPIARMNWKKSYEQHLAIENDTYQPRVYPLSHKLAGKQMPMPAKMPHMKKHYEKGLQAVTEVMQELCEIPGL